MNSAVFSSPSVSRASSSYLVSSRSSAISKGASLAPQLISMLLAVLPQTKCQALFNQNQYFCVQQKLRPHLWERSDVWANLYGLEYLFVVISELDCRYRYSRHSMLEQQQSLAGLPQQDQWLSLAGTYQLIPGLLLQAHHRRKTGWHRRLKCLKNHPSGKWFRLMTHIAH